MRRIGVATLAGIMIAVLVVVGFGIFGLIRPGDKSGWQADGTLVVEKETGGRFVYDKRDGLLHPVLNYTSARLFLGSATVRVRYYSRSSLAAAGRGAPIGAPGLPDSIPPPGGLIEGAWTVCAHPTQDGPAVVGTRHAVAAPTVTLSVGFPVPGTHLDPDRALLVVLTAQADGDPYYLIWNDHALRIRDIRIATSGLSSLTVSKAVPVTGDWVNSIPPGPDLRPVDVPGRGVPGAGVAVGGVVRKIGQVLLVPGEAGQPDQYYVVLPAGVAPTTATDALLLLGDPRERAAYAGQAPTPIRVAAPDVAPRAVAAVGTAGFPPGPVPTIVDPSQGGPRVACSTYDVSAGTSVVSLTDAAPGARAPASGVVLPPGRAALVRVVPFAGGEPTGTTYLVTDAGVRYPVPSGDVLSALGYGAARQTPVLKGIVDMIPAGPALDPVVASRPVVVSPGAVDVPGRSPGSGD